MISKAALDQPKKAPITEGTAAPPINCHFPPSHSTHLHLRQLRTTPSFSQLFSHSAYCLLDSPFGRIIGLGLVYSASSLDYLFSRFPPLSPPLRPVSTLDLFQAFFPPHPITVDLCCATTLSIRLTCCAWTASSFSFLDLFSFFLQHIPDFCPSCLLEEMPKETASAHRALNNNQPRLVRMSISFRKRASTERSLRLISVDTSVTMLSYGRAPTR